jgi:hypothetical protein
MAMSVPLKRCWQHNDGRNNDRAVAGHNNNIHGAPGDDSGANIMWQRWDNGGDVINTVVLLPPPVDEHHISDTLDVPIVRW